MNRVGNRCACAADAQFADALAFQRVGFGVEFGKENSVHIEYIGMDRHMVFGEIVVHEAAKARVEDYRFFQGRAEAEDHAPDRLRSRGLFV